MKLLIIFSSIFGLLIGGCQHNPSQRTAPDAIQVQTDGLFEKLVAVRRDIHQHPEVAGHESRTAATISAHLSAIGLEVQAGQYGHSVIGILRGGHPGKTVAWRAELDALPGDFRDPALFRSQNPGVHHACGHDVHIAIALGIAEVLAKQRDSLHGTVVFVFQPEEETFKGAKALMDRGIFSSITPDEIYGLHVAPLPVGQIVVRADEMYAYARRVSIRLKNELSKVDIVQLTKNLNSELSRSRTGAKPWQLQDISDPAIGLTSPSNAFQDYLIMDATFDARTENGDLVLDFNLYETTASQLGGIISRVERVIDASGHKRQLVSVSYVQENPTVLNNAALTRFAIRTLQRSRSVGAVRPTVGQVPFFNDDFAYFQQKIPGVYFFLGGSNAGKGLIAMNHAPDFQVDEESIRVGVSSFSSLLVARLGTPGQAEQEPPADGAISIALFDAHTYHRKSHRE
ncbi:M20 metallopeptidase family protein [Pseudoduganella aquatica]|uniref:M20 metallopeptidase family protein n=1 Tax=Pseudoduganella aquatica TaxID=2660641 RepID=UPI001E5B09FC|nr:amidohydrolase [Pseudoduganella aquatica]